MFEERRVPLPLSAGKVARQLVLSWLGEKCTHFTLNINSCQIVVHAGILASQSKALQIHLMKA